ncbi:6,7-dimethyl-8-ribityllumazine synthase [Thermogutta terrifontis]|jgi:6,7-dimethyl-8-ribityllumazine synthase|uniref:6,7-dimethyl-8-ribityllumazine synthase n=1 Tax=Thermogutta terrifontis TaxID=1331910 RepID=A0A286REB6_9BACT|nr:6,7-dimethyl-8-ribityllumazine synthase [Thermogutta terrifontis]ASV74301.1 6,7-dimethyl-8-ribityllumazine synthase [Thermogutta terrifontis]
MTNPHAAMNLRERFPGIRVFEGTCELPPGRFAVVVSRFNETITNGLLQGALETLTSAGVSNEAIDVFWVPGAFEIPTVAQWLASSRKYLAVICLGAVIKGETSHDQHINRAVSLQIAEIGVKTGVPVLFGVITCDTLEQAMARSAGSDVIRSKDRSGRAVSNKGAEAAQAALEMVRLMEQMEQHLQIRRNEVTTAEKAPSGGAYSG